MTDRIFLLHKAMHDAINDKQFSRRGKVSGKFETPYMAGVRYRVQHWDELTNTIKREITALLSDQGYEFLEDV